MDDEYGGRLPVHVRCLLDEFANIKIPDMQRLIAVLRSREISAALIVQAQSQLKAIYKDNADTITGNCDTTLFLGGKEKTTLKEMSELLGKETIDAFNTSENRGQSQSYGLNYQKLGKELMSQDEIAVMDGGKCILSLRGVRPFLSAKYNITKHPRPPFSKTQNGGRIFCFTAKSQKHNNHQKFKEDFMAFFESTVGVLQTLVIALGAGLGIWGVINLLEGYGSDNPASKSQGMKHYIPK